jgi:Domain of unknown function (DUF4331)
MAALTLVLGGGLTMSGASVLASSHREAPFVTKNPKVDATDFYMFNSYEATRAGFVTLIANYQPLQDAYGGPNYFAMDPEALYEIHVDNNGDAVEDLTFQFQFQNSLKGGEGLKVPVGGKMIAVPLHNIGPVTAADSASLNVDETYTLKVVRGARRASVAKDVTNATGGGKIFTKPSDNVGTKSFPDYGAYAAPFVYNVNIPDCATPARVFVGQRAESFAVNLGVIFDLVHAPPAVVIGGNTAAGRMAGGASTIANKNITSIALEVPTTCLVAAGKTIVSGWTTASLRQGRAINPKATYGLPAKEGGAWAQVSRLGNPLVNEVVIGLKDKDRFNSSEPKDDAQFAEYVTNPSLPKLLEILFGSAGVMAPTKFPRADLVAAFLTGVDMVNKDGSTAEVLRLNTAIAGHAANQNNLGAAPCFVLGVLTTTGNANCDAAGFPNGRRPGDDVTDIALRAMMGFLLPPADAPSGQLGFTDAVLQDASQFEVVFPYLKAPLPGATGPTM